MTKSEELRLWADVLEKPYRAIDGKLRPPIRCNLLAAEAMRFMADNLDKTQDDNNVAT